MSREDFKSFVVTDPNLVDQQLDVSKLATTTPTRKELLGGISTLPGVKYDPTLQSSFTDLLAYFSGGLPRLPQTPTASNVNVSLPGGSDGGGGGGTVSATTTAPITSTTIPTTAPFIETSPNVLSATDPVTGQPTSGNIVDPKTGDVFAPGDYSDVAGTLADPREKIDYTQKDPSFWETAKNKFLATGEDVGNFFTNLKNQGMDITNMAGEAIANLAGSKVTGIPLLGTAIQAVGEMLPKQDPRQTALNELYDVKDGTIQSGLMTGYNPVSGVTSDPIYGLQKAYDKRINTIEDTLKDKYNMTDAEIADVRAGSYTGDVDTNLLQTLTDLDKAKAKEKSILDLYSGDIQDTGDAGLAELEAAKTRAGIQPTDPFLDIPDRQYAEPTIDTDIGTMKTTAGVNPFAGIDTGVGEFDIMGTEPTLQEVAAANNINIAGGIPTYETLPEGASKTGTPVDALNPINRKQHFDNTEKLKDAVREGKISNETYNRLSAFDARKTMGLGAVTGTLASGAYQGIQSLLGMGEAVADQPIGEAIDDTVRNIQGVSGNITPEEQIQYQEIISGKDIYRDPIMGMVDQPTRGTLAGEPGLPDLMDEFDMTAFDEPTETLVDPAAMSLAEARAAMTQPTGIQMPGARTPIEIGEIDPYQESYVFPNEIITQPMSEFDTRQEKDRIVKQREDKQRVDDQRAMQEQIAAAEKAKAREEEARKAQERMNQRDDSPPPSAPSFDPGGGFVDQGGGGEFGPAPAPKSIPDRGRGGPPSVSSRPSAPSQPDYSNVRTGGPPSRGGGGGGPPSQGGKIVCTMMNQSYGFGSFRNKIWIKYARDHLSPEYQKGYHKIFLPLVKYAKQDGTTNRIVKKILEHIAVHRTIDIRQEARGKRHLLGRVYRKILEPICYWVGKYAK